MRTTLAAIAAAALSAELAAQGSPSDRGSTVTFGAAVAVIPRYPGSDEHRVRPLPTVQWTLGSRHLTAGPRLSGDGGTLSALIIGTPRVGFATEMGFLDKRPESRADALAGWMIETVWRLSAGR
jgi:outer membrane scaffolding protein for murein synthesis (MipA/OmpV family)